MKYSEGLQGVPAEMHVVSTQIVFPETCILEETHSYKGNCGQSGNLLLTISIVLEVFTLQRKLSGIAYRPDRWGSAG